MNSLAMYRIPFMGLKPGNHEFQLNVDPEFFACFPETEIHNAYGTLDIILDRLETTMSLRLELKLIWKVPCGRCLDELTFPLNKTEHIAIRNGEKSEISDELWILNKNEIDLDLSQTIYEMAHLARPTHQIHENELDCDPKMLGYTINDSEEDSDERTDPRWDALKNLK